MSKRLVTAAVALIALLSLGACGTPTSRTATTGDVTGTTEPADVACESVNLDAANIVGTGGEPGDFTASKAVAAKAPGRSNAYLMAISFVPSTGGDPVEGVWLTSGLTAADVAPIMAVDGAAHEFSHWPNSFQGEMLDITEPGAQETLDCLAD